MNYGIDTWMVRDDRNLGSPPWRAPCLRYAYPIHAAARLAQPSDMGRHP